MLKKTIVSFYLLFPALSHAEICPSVADIKLNHFNQWQPLNIDSAEPIVGERLQRFKQDVTHFALANWMPDAPEGAGQCFYSGAQPDGDYLEVYLAKTTNEPNKNFGNWHKVGFDVMACDASIGDCRFKD